MSTNPSQEPTTNRPHRARDTIRPEAGHDPYNPAASLPGPVVCGTCGAAFTDGRWRWLAPGAKPASDWATTTCPACRRIEDDFPAGVLVIEGAFLAGHTEDVVGVVKAEEQLEKQEHPLNRIASMEQMPGRIEITTTDTHLPRRLVYALHRAYEGELSLKYSPGAGTVRAEWRRDDPTRLHKRRQRSRFRSKCRRTKSSSPRR